MKNVRVIDEQGNEYEATYLKRAKGLVKHGRARFLSDNVICLACPPNSTDLEDSQMKDFLFGKKNQAPTAEKGKSEEQPAAVKPAEAVSAPEAPEMPKMPELPEIPEIPEAPKATDAPAEEISTAYLLEQLAAIQRDSAYLKDAMDKVAQMGRGDETRAGVLADMVKARETTNQRLIATYSELLRRKNPAKLPNFDDFGKKWNGWKDKVKENLKDDGKDGAVSEAIPAEEPETEALPIEGVSESNQWGAMDETIRRTVDKAMDLARQAVKGTKEAYSNLTVTVHSNKADPSARLDLVTDFLRGSAVSAEAKELFFEYLDELLELEPSARERVLSILKRADVAQEDKSLLFEQLDELSELDEAMQDKVTAELVTLLDGSAEEKALFFAYLDDIVALDNNTLEKVLDILKDTDLTSEEKKIIFEHLDDLT